MGKSTPQPPPAPNPQQVAAAQTGSNVQTAIANSILGNANEVTPWGNVTYSQIGTQPVGGNGASGSSFGNSGFSWSGTGNLPSDVEQKFNISPNSMNDRGFNSFNKQSALGSVFGTGGGESYNVPQWQRTVTLNPQEQKKLDQQRQLGIMLNDLAMGQTKRVGNVLSQPIDVDGLQDRQRYEQAMFDRMNPQLDRQRAQLENTLLNQGLVRGTQAFNSSMDEASRAENDARLAIIGQGGNEQSRAIQMALALRNQPINEITALMSGGQVSVPQFAQYQGGQVSPTPVGNYIYNSAALNNQNFQQQQSQNNAMMGGLFGLGGSLAQGAMMFSDRRLKTDIRETGAKLNGINLYSYRYLWETGRRLGVMADEVLRVKPEAVASIGGFLAVDYGRL